MILTVEKFHALQRECDALKEQARLAGLPELPKAQSKNSRALGNAEQPAATASTPARASARQTGRQSYAEELESRKAATELAVRLRAEYDALDSYAARTAFYLKHQNEMLVP